MQLSTRFPVAVQILILIAWAPDEYKITSELIAQSVNTNPALIRKIMGYLKKGGLVLISPGRRGIKLAREPGKITLFDVYRAMDLTDQGFLFGMHQEPNLRCPIGNRINDVLKPKFDQAAKALEESLAGVTIAELLQDFPQFYIPDGFVNK